MCVHLAVEHSLFLQFQLSTLYNEYLKIIAAETNPM